MATRRWTEEEKNKLVLLAKQGYTMDELVVELDRSRDAIAKYLSKMDIRLSTSNKWTRERTQQFKEDWLNNNISKKKLLKKYNKTWKQLSNKACSLNLGSRLGGSDLLTFNVIAEEMGIPIGKLYTWMEHGLKVRKNLITERHKYLVDSKDLLEFLQKNQSLFDASKISIYLFNNEPKWLKDKRKDDLLKNSTKNNREWSNEEDKQLISYYELGFTDEKISELLHRSVSAIEHRRGILGLIKDKKDIKHYQGKKYSKEELEILVKYSRYKTVYELAELLPNRTVSAIRKKCTQMGLSYHLKSEDCELFT